MSLEPLLEMQGISKTFNGLRVLKNVGLKVYPGEIHALMGENGAGKSTLMKILSGAYQADPGGEIRIGGQTIPTFDPATAKALGIAVIYQELSLCPNLSVAENIYLGRELRRGWTIDRKGMEAGCIEVLQRLGAEFTPGNAGQQPVDRRTPTGGNRPRLARSRQDPGHGRTDHAVVFP